jgi:hypothetical protein
MADETTTIQEPPSPTVPVNSNPSNQSDPAFVPSPLQQSPPVTENPWDAPAFKSEVAAAGFPGSPQTDGAFMAALYKFKSGGATTPTPDTGATTPSAAPVLSALEPDTAPANADITVNVTGTGFDASAKVLVGTTELSPTGTPTPTALSVLIPAADIANAGTVELSVKNGDGQTSNQKTFTLT